MLLYDFKIFLIFFFLPEFRQGLPFGACPYQENREEEEEKKNYNNMQKDGGEGKEEDDLCPANVLLKIVQTSSCVCTL